MQGPSVVSSLGARTAFLLPPFEFHCRRRRTFVSSFSSARGVCFNFGSSKRAPAARSPPLMDLTVLAQPFVSHSSSDPPVRGRSAGCCAQHVADAPRRGVASGTPVCPELCYYWHQCRRNRLTEPSAVFSTRNSALCQACLLSILLAHGAMFPYVPQNTVSGKLWVDAVCRGPRAHPHLW